MTGKWDRDFLQGSRGLPPLHRGAMRRSPLPRDSRALPFLYQPGSSTRTVESRAPRKNAPTDAGVSAREGHEETARTDVRTCEIYGRGTADAGPANGNPDPMPSVKHYRDHLVIYVSG